MTYSQFNPEKLVFFVGIPGSGWAKIDSLLRNCKKFNFSTSDFNEERWEEKKGLKYYLEHKGHFSGPGMEFGDGFDDISANYTKESFIEECLKPYAEVDNEYNYMVKCHFFCEKHNLEWLDKTFPNNKMIFVLRDKDLCDDRWLTSMTFTKTYPKYTAWQVVDDPNEDRGVGNHHPANEENFKKLNYKHNISMRKFLRTAKKPNFITSPTKYFLSKLDFDWNSNIGWHEYMAYIRNYCIDYENTKSPTWDTSIAFYNCHDVIDFS